jgi:hypothetical protein
LPFKSSQRSYPQHLCRRRLSRVSFQK